MKLLPIGISTLADIRNGGYVYVDKTPYLRPLVESGKYYFLSRPRRFGKTLLVDTFHQLFTGQEALFQGLHIHSHWNWTVKYPVIRFSFGSGVQENRSALDKTILYLLQQNAQRLAIPYQERETIAASFTELIQQAYAHYQQQVVILVDEYDKPLLDNITNTTVATAMRTGLRNLYSVIKDNDAYIRFAFLTGVSKFSKVSVFSGLNNLEDISLDARFGALCGYTQNELDEHFAEHLQGANLTEVRSWYNGYNWLGESVYNPYDILLFIAKGQEFLPYWFSTGTPTFLVDIVKSRPFYLPNLEAVKVSSAILDNFDVGRIEPVTLFFQTGYLTIKHKETLFPGSPPEYTLGYPNKEVRYSLTEHLLEHYLTDQVQERHTTLRALRDNDFTALEQSFRHLFATIAYQNYANNPIAHYEGYYAAVMYAYLCSLGLEVRTEVSHNKGRIDLALSFTLPNGQKQVYIFEFKVIDDLKGDGSALAQIKTQQYAAPYQDGQTQLFLVGIEFSKQTRNIVGFDWEKA